MKNLYSAPEFLKILAGKLRKLGGKIDLKRK